VHHYLFNVECSPRPGATYRVQDEIRQRAVRALQEGAARPGPHIVVSHSMGTVIAYDCLKRVAGAPAVDGLMTIGSPLGLDEIQDKLQPEWTKDNGFPDERVRGPWINVYDALDPVAAFDPRLGNDYRRAKETVVDDVNEQNSGTWRHDISKYLAGPQLRAKLRTLLGL
jgi:pimeloyl-ACP methyl ester carboxylesterase